MYSFFKKAREALFGSPTAKKSPQKRTRTLLIEELETRELLSATPLDWDWDGWWDGFTANDVQLDPLPSGYNLDSSSDGFGKISFGGNNLQIDATVAFVPDVVGDLVAFDTATRQGGTSVLNGNNDLIAGYNTETITVGIVSQDFGNGDWTYTETTAYTYNITAGNDAYWGGYSYVFSASSVAGTYTSTFFLTTSDHFTVNNTIATETNESTFSLTTVTTGSMTETVTTTHLHNTVNSVCHASDTRTTSENTTYSGTGTYSYVVAGGSVSGTITQSGQQITETSVSLSMMETGNGWITASGTQSALTMEKSSSSYQGSGGYTVTTESEGYFSLVSGTITESGSESETLTLTVSGVLSNGDWSITGSGTTTSMSDDSYFHVSSGSYSQSVSEPGSSSSVSGTHSATALRTNDSNGGIQLSLVAGTWEISGGTSASSGQSNDTSQFSESGSYASSGSGNGQWNNAGTFTRSGSTADLSDYTISSTYLLGDWLTAGSGSGSGYDNSHYAYNDTGTYVSVFSKGDGSSFTMSGTSSQNGSDQSSMNYQTGSTLQSDGSWLNSGSGCESGSSYAESSYEGGGFFTMTIDDPNIVGDASYQGSASHNGDSSTTSAWDVVWSIQNGIWSRTSGTGTTIDSNSTYLGFNGSANTTEAYTQGGVVYSTTSTRNTNGSEDDQSQTTLYTRIVDGDWNVLGGTGTGYGTSSSYHGYLTNGSYSSNSSSDAGGTSQSSSVTGTFSGSGHDEIESSSNLQFTWNGSGWDTTGTVDYNSSDSQQTQQNGSGTTTVVSAASSTTSVRTESFGNQSSTESQWQEWLNANGSRVLVSGSSTSTFSHEEEWTTNGTGTFSETSSTEDGGTIATSGSTVSTQKWTSNGAGNETFVVISNAWKLDNGTYSVTDTDYNSFSKDGTGTLTKGNQSCGITTTQWDETDIETTIDGNVKGNAGSKEWLYSGHDTYKTAGAYSYDETTRTGTYHRNIAGGMVSGTVTEDFSKFDNYNSETKSQLAEGSDEWVITFGTATVVAGYARVQSYQGSGSYSDKDLTGTVTESGSSSAITSGAKIVSTYNTTTKNWEDSKEGILTYITTENFSDSSSGSEGNVTINDRTAEFSSAYTETHFLDTGIIDYVLAYHETTTFDAVENRSVFNGINGIYEKTHDYNNELTLNANWTHDTTLDAWEWAATRTFTLTENLKENFTLGSGNSVFDTYTYTTADTYTGTLTETLAPTLFDWEFVNDGSFESLLLSDSAWQQTSLEADSLQSISTSFTKSNTLENMYSTVGDYWFLGTATFLESYSYDKMLQKHYADDTVTGNGSEHIYSSHSDRFDGGDDQEHEIGSGCGYGYTGYFSGFYGGQGTVSGGHWSSSSSKTDLIYTWVEGDWEITGGAVTTSGFGYEWEDTASHGTTLGERSSSHDELATVCWDYATGIFGITSVAGGGSGQFDFRYEWDSPTAYERGFYGEDKITGTETVYAKHKINETWDVSFVLVNGQVLRETEGGSTEVIESGISFSGGGSHSESQTTTTPSTQYNNYAGTVTTHFEREANLSESGSQSSSETITTSWSNRANAQGQLVRQASADSELTVKADGFYHNYLYEYSYSEFEGSYDQSGCDSYSYGNYYSYSESECTNDITEDYHTEMTTHRRSDGGDFYLVSFDGYADGYGSQNALSSSYSEWNKEDAWGYPDCGCGGGCGYGYSGYFSEGDEHTSDSWREIGYDYTADWGWSANGGASASVENHVWGDADGKTTGSWYYESGSDCGYGCGYESNSYSCSYESGSSCGYGDSYSDGCGSGCGYNYDETLSHTGWKDANQVITPFSVRWSPFSGSVSEDSGYSSGNFSAPGFSASVWETTNNNGGSASPSGKYSGMPSSNAPSHGGVYYNSYGYYGCGCGCGSGCGTSQNYSLDIAPISTGEPNFNNYAPVDPSAWLPKVPEHQQESLIVMQEAGSSWSDWFTLDTLSNALDIAGFVPGPIGMIADVANVGVSLAKGDWTGAGINAIAVIPGFGDAAKAGAMSLKVGAGAAVGVVAVKNLDNVSDAAKTALRNEPNLVKIVCKDKPPYRINTEHLQGSLKDGKTVLPGDAESVYKNSTLGPPNGKGEGAYWGKNEKGEIYRFVNSGDDTYHFNGVFDLRKDTGIIPRDIRKLFNR